MSVALKNTVRVAVLSLFVAGLTGCGSTNPMGPEALAVSPTTMETSASVAPMEELPMPGEGNETITVIEPVGGGSTISGKVSWQDRPGRRVGRGRRN